MVQAVPSPGRHKRPREAASFTLAYFARIEASMDWGDPKPRPGRCAFAEHRPGQGTGQRTDRVGGRSSSRASVSNAPVQLADDGASVERKWSSTASLAKLLNCTSADAALLVPRRSRCF